MNKVWIVVILISILVLIFLVTKRDRKEHHTNRKRIFSPADLTSWWAWGGEYYSSPMYKIRKSADPLGSVPEKPIYLKDTVFKQDVVPPFPRPQQTFVC